MQKGNSALTVKNRRIIFLSRWKGTLRLSALGIQILYRLPKLTFKFVLLGDVLRHDNVLHIQSTGLVSVLLKCVDTYQRILTKFLEHGNIYQCSITTLSRRYQGWVWILAATVSLRPVPLASINDDDMDRFPRLFLGWKWAPDYLRHFFLKRSPCHSYMTPKNKWLEPGFCACLETTRWGWSDWLTFPAKERAWLLRSPWCR